MCIRDSHRTIVVYKKHWIRVTDTLYNTHFKTHDKKEKSKTTDHIKKIKDRSWHLHDYYKLNHSCENKYNTHGLEYKLNFWDSLTNDEPSIDCLCTTEKYSAKYSTIKI